MYVLGKVLEQQNILVVGLLNRNLFPYVPRYAKRFRVRFRKGFLIRHIAVERNGFTIRNGKQTFMSPNLQAVDAGCFAT